MEGLVKPPGERYTIAVDFDGVLHSYTTPWVSAELIPDPPVRGAIEWLNQMRRHFDIVIHTTRARDSSACRAVRTWLTANGYLGDPEALHITDRKVPALVYIDDRAWRFEGPGSFPREQDVHLAIPWNKLPSADWVAGPVTKENAHLALGSIALRKQEISDEYWATRESLNEKQAVARLADAFARFEYVARSDRDPASYVFEAPSASQDDGPGTARRLATGASGPERPAVTEPPAARGADLDAVFRQMARTIRYTVCSCWDHKCSRCKTLDAWFPGWRDGDIDAVIDRVLGEVSDPERVAEPSVSGHPVDGRDPCLGRPGSGSLTPTSPRMTKVREALTCPNADAVPHSGCSWCAKVEEALNEVTAWETERNAERIQADLDEAQYDALELALGTARELIAAGVVAFRLTRDYVGHLILPEAPGWSWFDWVELAEKIGEEVSEPGCSGASNESTHSSEGESPGSLTSLAIADADFVLRWLRQYRDLKGGADNLIEPQRRVLTVLHRTKVTIEAIAFLPSEDDLQTNPLARAMANMATMSGIPDLTRCTP